MTLSEAEKRERIAALFQRIQLAESQRRGRVVPYPIMLSKA